ncbi:MAG TPA: hypothetical protein VMF66_06660 [Candidatus Acidoferrum sp.]|nr:hypothetical protein [Candidatus Acidoferrum sp.]
MTKNIRPVVLLAVLATPALAMAQSVFNGTWKMDVKTAKFDSKPQVLLVQNGTYECKSCNPPTRIKADGMDHAVDGNPYVDAFNAKVLDSRTILVAAKKNGKTIGTAKDHVSADGKTMIVDFTTTNAASGAVVNGQSVLTRVASGPLGSHVVSGSWQIVKDNVSENDLITTYRVNGGELTMTSPTGQSYKARLNGTEAAYHGDPGTTSVSVKKIDANTIEETDLRNGKVISITRMTVLPGGKTMKIASDDKLRGEHDEIMAAKQ